MSEREHPAGDAPAPDDERAVRAALREAWQAEGEMQPDAALDARVRAAVLAELAQTGASHAATRDVSGGGATILRPSRWRRWSVPLGLAATVLLSFGVVRLIMPPRVEAPVPAMAPQAVRPDHGPVMDAPGAAPSARAKASKEGVAADALPAPRRAAPAAPAKAADMDSLEAARGAGVPSGAPQPAETEMAPPAQAMENKGEAMAPASPPAVSSGAAAQSGREQSGAPAARGLAAPPVLLKGTSPAGPPPGVRDVEESPAAQSLAAIRRQLDDGDVAGARKALAAWRADHPQAPLPHWAQRLLNAPP